MDYKRLIARAAGQILLFLCGCGAVLAVQAQLYASSFALLLLGFWIAATVIWSRPATTPLLAPLVNSGHAVQWRMISSVLDQIPAPLIQLGQDGVLKAANREARRLFLTDDRIIDPPRTLREALGADARDERRSVSFDVTGETRTYAVTTLDLTAPGDVARIAMLVDIQPEVRAAEAAALRDLMQVLSHEIMNALTPIASLAATSVDLLEEGTPAAIASAQGAMEILARRAGGLTRFVDAYRTLARLPPPILHPASVSALFDEAAQLFRGRWTASKVQLSVTKPAPDIVASMDLDQMVHALINLLSNAADAALAGEKTPACVELSARRREGGVTLVVQDNGPGVAACDRDRIFQPFFTTKAEGSGIGLSFARQVALSHGGSLLLAPSQGLEGAAFELSV